MDKAIKYTLYGLAAVIVILIITWLIVWAVTGDVNPLANVTTKLTIESHKLGRRYSNKCTY